MTVRELYEKSIEPLLTADRLALAKIILNNIPTESLVDFSGNWSDEDLQDFSKMTWNRANGAASDAAN